MTTAILYKTKSYKQTEYIKEHPPEAELLLEGDDRNPAAAYGGKLPDIMVYLKNHAKRHQTEQKELVF
jgi:hypothetical protein